MLLYYYILFALRAIFLFKVFKVRKDFKDGIFLFLFSLIKDEYFVFRTPEGVSFYSQFIHYLYLLTYLNYMNFLFQAY